MQCLDDDNQLIKEEIPLQIVKCLRDPNRLKKEPAGGKAKRVKREVSSEKDTNPATPTGDILTYSQEMVSK